MGEIKVEPEGFGEMVRKHTERNDENLEKVRAEVAKDLGKPVAEVTEQDLMNASKEKVKKLQDRREIEPLEPEQRHVFTDPNDPATKALAKEVTETIAKTDEAMQSALTQQFSSDQLRSLKGRVTIGKPESKVGARTD